MDFNFFAVSTIDWVRDQAIGRLTDNVTDERHFVASLVTLMARARIDAKPGHDELRAWHELVRDVAAMIRAIDPELAGKLRQFSDVVRTTIVMAERNPADQLALRPTSRRVLQAIDLLGNDCSQNDVRKQVGQKEQHFSNILRTLREAGFVESVGDPNDGRNRRLSITAAGRDALQAATGDVDGIAAPRPRYSTPQSPTLGFRSTLRHADMSATA